MDIWSPALEPGGIKLFICYRRRHDEFAVGWIHDRLKGQFGDKNVFRDEDSIPRGVDFRDILQERVGSCDALLAFITEDWLTMQAEDGRRRLDTEHDFVRFEIQTALDRNVQVIPVLIGGAKMPQAHHLPTQISNLAYRQAVNVRPGKDFERDIAELIAALKMTESSLEDVRKEHSALAASIENGDWLLALQMSSKAAVPIELQGMTRYRVLNELRNHVGHLGKAAQAIERLDFAAAVDALANFDESGPPIIAAARRLVQMGRRIDDARTSDPAAIRTLEREFQQIVCDGDAPKNKVPGERQVRELFQRLLKGSDYQDAVRIYEAARFDQAEARFAALGDYKDSKERFARCIAWRQAFDAVRTHEWDEARRRLTELIQKGDEPRARSVQHWCVFAKRVLPALKQISRDGLAAEERVLWDVAQESPYHALQLSPAATLEQCNARGYDLQSKPGGMTDAERAGWDALRLVERRLVVDFSVYSARNAAAAGTVLDQHFGFARDEPSDATLARIQHLVSQSSETGRAGNRNLIDSLIGSLGDDGGILAALTRNYDAALQMFLEQARRVPEDVITLHHLGLAAFAKADIDPDAADLSETWEIVATAWSAVFASDLFWRAWWAQRRRTYVTTKEQLHEARAKLQRYCVDALNAAAERDPAIAELFRSELNAARIVADAGGIPIGRKGQRVTVGPQGVVMLRIEKHVAAWIATFPLDALESESPSRRICVAFSSLAPAQYLLDENRPEESIVVLESVADAGGAQFGARNPGFAALAKGRGPALFRSVRESLAQHAHLKAAIAAVSEIPVSVAKAVEHWQQAAQLAGRLKNQDATCAAIREVVAGRCQVLRSHERDLADQLASLNEAVQLASEATEQGWDSDDGMLQQVLVDSLLDRAVHLSNAYDMDKEARQDALRAWGMAQTSLHALVVLCTASLHYAKELHRTGHADLAQALLSEVDARLNDAETLFSGNPDLAKVRAEAQEARDILAGDPHASVGVEKALESLKALAGENRSEAEDGRLPQAMVLEADSNFAGAIELYWQLALEKPDDRESRGRLAWCYRTWLLQLGEPGNEQKYREVLAEAMRRCPGARSLEEFARDAAGAEME